MTDQEKIALIKKLTAQYVKTIKDVQKMYTNELHRIQKNLDEREMSALRSSIKRKK
ncbi:MAG: hypothetical protein Q7S47_01590 [bacterium]|nr:hypothetical protein [bacterium]